VEVFVIKPNFNSMSRKELRAYLIANPNDQEAFYTFVDRFASETSSETFDIPKSNNDLAQVEDLIRQKLGMITVK
jgi:aromatic ring hydroxylase